MVDCPRPHLALAALALSIVLSGCATLQPIPLQPLAINVPNDPIRIYWLHAYQVGSGIRVVGTVRPSRGVYRAGRGHIDVTAMFSDRRDPQTIATRLDHLRAEAGVVDHSVPTWPRPTIKMWNGFRLDIMRTGRTFRTDRRADRRSAFGGRRKLFELRQGERVAECLFGSPYRPVSQGRTSR